MVSRMPRPIIVVLSAALVVVLALVMGGSTLDNKAQAGVVKPEMSLSAHGPDVTCDGQDSTSKGAVPKPLKCDVPLGGTFTLSIEINVAPASGYDLWTTEIDYGALTYKKTASAADEVVPFCPAFGATRVQNPSVVAHLCDFGVGNKTHDLGNIVELEFNCTDSKSNNVIELIPDVTGFYEISPPDFFGSNVDSLGINCVAQDGQININVVDAKFQTKKVAGTCWLISVVHFDVEAQQLINKPFAVLADNNAKPVCAVPIKGTLVDKDPAVGRIAITIPAAAMAEFDSTEWHFQQVQTAASYNLDPTKYVCTLSGLFKKFDDPNLTACDEADPYVIKNVAKSRPVNVFFEAKPPLDPALLQGLCVLLRDGIDQLVKSKFCDGGPQDQDGIANGEIHFFVDPNNPGWLEKGQITLAAQTVKAAGLFELDPTQVPGDGDAKQDCDLMVVQKCDIIFSYIPQKLTKPGDTDGDGCPDEHENRDKSQASQGGGCDWLNPNDYYSVLGPGAALPKDGVIDLPNDILSVILNFASSYLPGDPAAAGLPGLRSDYDRGPATAAAGGGPNVWNMTAPDGAVDLPNDILGVILQFGHNCV